MKNTLKNTLKNHVLKRSKMMFLNFLGLDQILRFLSLHPGRKFPPCYVPIENKGGIFSPKSVDVKIQLLRSQLSVLEWMVKRKGMRNWNRLQRPSSSAPAASQILCIPIEFLKREGTPREARKICVYRSSSLSGKALREAPKSWVEARRRREILRI